MKTAYLSLGIGIVTIVTQIVEIDDSNKRHLSLYKCYLKYIITAYLCTQIDSRGCLAPYKIYGSLYSHPIEGRAYYAPKSVLM